MKMKIRKNETNENEFIKLVGCHEFPDGAKWLGGLQVTDDDMARPHGLGIEKFRSGMTYRGEWREGRREGHGVLRFPDGATFQGEFSENLPNGRGVLTMRDGVTYTGTFGAFPNPLVAGRKMIPDGPCYVGEFQMFRKHGQGRQTSPCGMVYEGEWQNNLQHGKGTLRMGDGSVAHHGDWNRGSIANA